MNQPAPPAWFRLRKDLSAPLAPPVLPDGVRLVPLAMVRPPALHALLVAAYANGGGTVADFQTWWTRLVEDTEFDSALVFIAVDPADHPVALCQCWSGGFIKDLVVAGPWRGRGLAEAMLLTAFGTLKARGIPHVDLKVETQNAGAQRLYARVGMVEIA